MFGFKLGKLCPYVESCDVIVGENTCDGKKKAYEIFRPLVKDLYVMDLPQTKSETGRLVLERGVPQVHCKTRKREWEEDNRPIA